MSNVLRLKRQPIQGLPLVRKLFSDAWAAWLWLPVRVWLGYVWVESALGKINDPAWVVTGDAIRGFWTRAVAIPEQGRPPIAFEWYRGFIQSLLDAQAHTWFARLVAYGELLVGIALIVGVLTGVAAFFGGFMNWNFIMAGTASTNGLMLLASVGLVAAWKVAGLVGADTFVLRWLSTFRAAPSACDCGADCACAGQPHAVPAASAR